MTRRTGTSANGMAAGIALVLTLAGCGTWQPMRPPIGEAVTAPDSTQRVLVKLIDGTKVEIILGGVDADSLRGWRSVDAPGARHWSEQEAIKRGTPIAIPRSAIAAVETRQFDATLTITGVLVAIGLASAAVFTASWDGFME